MKNSNFKSDSLIAFCASLLFAMFAMSLPAWGQDKVKVSPGSNVQGTIDSATSKYHTKKVVTLKEVSLDYTVFRRRIRGLISYIENDVKEDEIKLKDLNREYGETKKELKRLSGYYNKYAQRYNELKRTKNFKLEFEKLIVLLAKYKGDIDKGNSKRIATLNNIDALNSKLITRKNQLGVLKPLALATAKSKKEARPVIDELRLISDGSVHFEAHLELKKEIVKMLTVNTEHFKKQRDYYDKELKQTAAAFKKVEKHRNELIDEATKANEEYIVAFQDFGRNVKAEVYTRWLGQTALDITEIVVEGKTPVGMLLESSAKLAEALIVNGGLGKSFSLYDSSALIGEYQKHGQSMEAHWNDAYSTHKPYTDEFMRTMINTGEEMLDPGAEFRKQLTDIITSQTKAARSSKNLLESLGSGLGLKQRTLVQAEVAYLQETLSQTARNAPNPGALSALDRERKLAREEAERFAKKVAQRQAKLKAIEEATKKTEKALKNFSSKEFFKNPSMFLNKEVMKKVGKGVGRGMVWDGLRASFHTAGDAMAESYWTTFLDKDIQVKGMVSILRNYNKIWLSMSSDQLNFKKMYKFFKMAYEQSKMILQRYQSKMSGVDGMHVIKNESIKNEDGKVTVSIKTRGALYGLKAELSGDAGSADLKPEKKLPYYNTFTDAIVQEQLDDINKVLSWDFTLPSAKPISKLTKSSGNLKLVVDVQ
jgi:flagellar biosynthesis chaperone FliJ